MADDVGLAEGCPIHRGKEEVRIARAILGVPMQAFVHLEAHGAPAVRAGGRDLDFQLLISEAPLHEGRNKGVLRSSTEDALAGAEAQAMRCAVGGHREGPGDGPGGVAHQEEEMLLQVVKQGHDGGPVEIESFRDLGGRQRLTGIAGQLADDEVSDGMMPGSQECQVVFHDSSVPSYQGTEITKAPAAKTTGAPRVLIPFRDSVIRSHEISRSNH